MSNEKIKYDVPIEVTKSEYDLLTKKYCGIIAHRESNGKYFVKFWLTKYIKP